MDEYDDYNGVSPVMGRIWLPADKNGTGCRIALC
ncbi:Uncharacterised protein [Raoultella terrigena]|uniref:Uncharacterized protein n=1 Tax=Raoultella terrigena TaxID=577 RepID=A0A3P8K6Y1_RAOTE|nr:Uncharacterised protein [Raoultella terrigena]